ncbi:MAG: ribonuclease HII [Anaerolineae bacterium]|nr:ribonuclease HII [Anaerolineae bacterium]
MIRRQSPDLHFEISTWQSGLERLAGLDEAGRGAWAGPVSAGAVILPAESGLTAALAGVRDSKQMTPAERARWAAVIKETALSWGVGMASHEEVDQLGIVPATRLAMRRALEQLTAPPEALLIDALQLPEIDLPQSAILHGDALCLSIAAASVLAKTARDALMTAMDAIYPNYGFARHKGYGTSSHRAALEQLGPCEIHRRSFAPVRKHFESSKNQAFR